MLYGRHFEKEYKESLYDTFCYDFYSDEYSYILKLKFNYIKHHTSVAFPAPILLKGIPTKIAYEIPSKNTADIISGSITVENNNVLSDNAE